MEYKGYDNCLKTCIDKKIILFYKMRYLLEPYTRSKNKIKVKLDLSNYATTPDLKSTAGNTDLVNLKSKIDELNIW